MPTYKQKFNKKYGFKSNESHSIKEIAKLSGIKYSNALKIVEKAYKNEKISGINRRHALEIIETLKPTIKKEIKTKVETTPVDEEILHVFRNWKQ